MLHCSPWFSRAGGKSDRHAKCLNSPAALETVELKPQPGARCLRNDSKEQQSPQRPRSARLASTGRKVTAEDSAAIGEQRVGLDTDPIPYLPFHRLLITSISAEEQQSHARPAGQRENTGPRGAAPLGEPGQ